MNNIVELFAPLLKHHADDIRKNMFERFTRDQKVFIARFPKGIVLQRKSARAYIWLTTFEEERREFSKRYEDKPYLKAEALADIEIVKGLYERYGYIRLETLRKYAPMDSKNYISMYDTFGMGIYSDKYFSDRVEKIIVDTINANKVKLVYAINRKLGNLEVASVSEKYSGIGAQGIQGTYEIKLASGKSGTMSTQSIGAGGYNIQCYHYRYLIALDAYLKEKEDACKADPMALDDKELAVAKLVAAGLETITEHAQIPAPVLSEVNKIKGMSRNWNPLIKKGFIYKREFGHYYIKRFNYFVSRLGVDVFNRIKDKIL